MMSKDTLRLETQSRLQSLSDQERNKASIKISNHFINAPFLSDSNSISCFSPLKYEPSLLSAYEALLAQGKKLFFPKLVDKEYQLAVVEDLNQLIPGSYGVLEPITKPDPTAKIDLWLIPGVAFDLLGTRIGRGKGFYDRLLMNEKGLKCAVCFHTQVHTAPLPKESHDVSMDVLISDKQMYVTMGI